MAQNEPSTATRAYTLRLQGADPNDSSWRDALWRTHEAVNVGANAFGGWLLTLRGGLDHTLADAQIKGGKVKPDRNPTDEERKQRRILLALSWLSVESRLGAPKKFIIASGQDSAKDRHAKVVAALEEILKNRGLSDIEIGKWKIDCSASLGAPIRDDAVWVNRSKAFDEAVKATVCSLTRELVWDMLGRFLGSPEAYLAPLKGSMDDSSGIKEEDKTEKRAREEDKTEKRVLAAGGWLSERFGTGKGADFSRMAEVYQKIAVWAADTGADWWDKPGKDILAGLAVYLSEFNPASNDLAGVRNLVSGRGYKSATRNLLKIINAKTSITPQDFENLKDRATKDAQHCSQKVGSKGQRPYADAILREVESVCGFTYLQNNGSSRHSNFAVILGHAARRVSLAHTWIKRAEMERGKFEENTKKADQVPRAAKSWLDRFCRERSDTSGALEQYRIRRRAIDGWEKVVAAWTKRTCSSCADRIAAVRALQDDPEIDKFGDIQLFEALAQDGALCVWHKDGDVAGDPDPQPLIDHALATEAEFKKRHFKVPAYRHPDAFLHPVFCDFGNSSWDICFDVHKNVQTSSPHGLLLALWTGNGINTVALRWQSKRLARDLGMGQRAQNDEVHNVARADRFGRAASNVSQSDQVKVAGLFEQKHWNGRLQAPRRQLEAIAAVRDDPNLQVQERERKMSGMKARLRWLVTFSAKLQPYGPWCEFAQTRQFKINPKLWPHADVNKPRKKPARLILCRLPGLRVLSVDLGHRYAAACAVWEAVSAGEARRACRDAGHKEPEANDLYLHLKKKVKKQNKAGEVEIEETTIYRRIGADTLTDAPHPAPWARLERQFLIRLQGEEEGARAASNEEIWAVHQLETCLGRSVPLIDGLAACGWGVGSDKQKARLEALKRFGWKPVEKSASDDAPDMDEDHDLYRPSLSVDDLMSHAVSIMRLALERHGDRARIAHYCVTNKKTVPGAVKKELDESEHIELLKSALNLWHNLFSSRRWRSDKARPDEEKLWNEHIANRPEYKPLEKIDGESSAPTRRNKKKENLEKLHDVAKALVKDVKSRNDIHNAFKKLWEEDDVLWKKHIRWFKDWILPRGKADDDPSLRKVGGLSLTRLAALTEFRRKVQVGFFTRLHPDGEKTEARERFGQSALDALDRLREQRVKQLASRIVEAALGIGRIKRTEGGKEPKRPNVRVDEPCHAVVVENLTRYRPDETRTRRENRGIMTWASSKVKKYLGEACELHSLHLREVPAVYTSRQDSRTGAPGIRCKDVSVKEFMLAPFWRKQVSQAEALQAENKGDARVRFLCCLNAEWQDKTVDEWNKAGVVRIPFQGGEIFVSARRVSPAAKGLQADLNAAANIGLRALTDPDWPGRWWYVPCASDSFKPVKDRVDGCAAVDPDMPLRQPGQTQSVDAVENKRGKKDGGKSKEVVNLWRDISSLPLLSPDPGEWQEYAAYKNKAQCQVIGILKERIKGGAKQPRGASG